jgi:hypothetical protein
VAVRLGAIALRLAAAAFGSVVRPYSKGQKNDFRDAEARRARDRRVENRLLIEIFDPSPISPTGTV